MTATSAASARAAIALGLPGPESTQKHIDGSPGQGGVGWFQSAGEVSEEECPYQLIDRQLDVRRLPHLATPDAAAECLLEDGPARRNDALGVETPERSATGDL